MDAQGAAPGTTRAQAPYLQKHSLRGERLVLVPPCQEDDVSMCLIFSDPTTMQFLPQLQRPGGWTLEEMAARRCSQDNDTLQNKRVVFSIHLLECSASLKEGSVVGTIGLNLSEDEYAELGIILHSPYWKRGIYTEAAYLLLRYGFDTLGIKHVLWRTQSANESMRRWCESLGMSPVEIHLPEMGDSIQYSLYDTDWSNKVRHQLEQKLTR